MPGRFAFLVMLVGAECAFCNEDDLYLVMELLQGLVGLTTVQMLIRRF